MLDALPSAARRWPALWQSGTDTQEHVPLTRVFIVASRCYSVLELILGQGLASKICLSDVTLHRLWVGPPVTIDEARISLES